MSLNSFILKNFLRSPCILNLIIPNSDEIGTILRIITGRTMSALFRTQVFYNVSRNPWEGMITVRPANTRLHNFFLKLEGIFV